MRPLRPLTAALLLAAVAAGSTSTSQDAIVEKFDRYVKTSLHELEDLQGMITEHRKSMEHGEEIVGGDFQPLPPLGPQTSTEPPTTTTTTTEQPTTTAGTWGVAGFLGPWAETTTEAAWQREEPKRWSGQQTWTTTKAPWAWSPSELFPTTHKPWLPPPPPVPAWDNDWPKNPVPPPRRQFQRLNTRGDVINPWMP